MYEVNLKVLNELAKLAPKEDVRYYLNSVQVNIYPDHSIYAVTNGHYLVMYRETIDNPGTASLIIPRETLVNTKPMNKPLDNARLEQSGDQWVIQNTMFHPVDATYPDIIRVMPQPENLSSDNPAQTLDIDSLYALNKCYQKVSVKKHGNLRVMYNKDKTSGAFLDGNDQFIAVLMPVKQDAGTTPEWYDCLVQPVKQAKTA